MRRSSSPPEGRQAQHSQAFRCAFLVASAAFLPVPVAGEPATVSDQVLGVSALKGLTIEELANLSVTSVTKREERASDAAAAVYVLTPEEVIRSGATTLPDALRQVPGMEVARVNGHDWAVSARGFNDLFANKLLVMIDGRTVYTPLFSGVYWQVQDAVMEDLDRIEVVRGPGGALWGANAVNGVINILSQPARETTGVLVSGGGGSTERAFGRVRYGTQISDQSYGRVYVKSGLREDFPLASGEDGNDRWNQTQGGFRFDWEPDRSRMLTVQGDMYGGNYDQTFLLPSVARVGYSPVEHVIDTFGANVLSRWRQEFSENSALQVQAYFDHAQQESAPTAAVSPAYAYTQVVDTADVDLQQSWHLGSLQELVVGGGYRFISEQFDGTPALTLLPSQRDVNWWNVFAQDELSLVENVLALTLGAKVEHNDFTGWELQPSARLRWKPLQEHTMWAAVSRAVRTPSLAEEDLWRPSAVLPPAAPGQPPTLVVFRGSPDFLAEDLVAYELGYRFQRWGRLSVDAAVFLHDYGRLRTLEPGPLDYSTLPEYVTLPVQPHNEMSGEVVGTEWAVTFEPEPWWRLRLAYTFLQAHLRLDSESVDTVSTSAEGMSPENQVGLQSSWDLPAHLRLDAIARWVDELPALDVPAYPSLDVRLAWSPHRDWELSVVGQNLLDPQHPEFGNVALSGAMASEVPRGVYGQLTFHH